MVALQVELVKQQFIKSDLYNELGLSSLNNMKKERLITSEVDDQTDQIYPYVDNMLRNRKKGIEMVNKLFNGKVAVDFSSTWKDKADQRNTPETKTNDVTHETPETNETEKTNETPETNETEKTNETVETKEK